MRSGSRFGWICLWALLSVGSWGVSGCHGDAGLGAPKPEQKTFHLLGKIVAADASAGTITVSHGAIPGFMDAMTMPYKLVQPNTISELHPGDVITARVVVNGDATGPLTPLLDNIVVVAQARPDTVPTVQYHVPQVGDLVPDFHLLTQSGKQIHLAQFRGRVLLLELRRD